MRHVGLHLRNTAMTRHAWHGQPDSTDFQGLTVDDLFYVSLIECDDSASGRTALLLVLASRSRAQRPVAAQVCGCRTANQCNTSLGSACKPYAAVHAGASAWRAALACHLTPL